MDRVGQRRASQPRQRPPSPPPPRAVWWDAALYGASALLAVVAAVADYIPLQRQWARLAVGPYAAGAVAAALLALAWRRRPARRPLLARTVVALAVLVGATLVPLTLELGWRAHAGDGSHAQSEVFLIEQGARTLLHGTDPTPSPTTRGRWPATRRGSGGTSPTCRGCSPSACRARCWGPGR
ncbi:MAG TPA: hypothetical protein VFD04_14505 [Actinomycetes bacterium]|nr:hypothetical protein [Actinomycetes bacterium]